MLAHWTLIMADGGVPGGASIAASFSIGVRPFSAIEKRWWLYRYRRTDVAKHRAVHVLPIEQNQRFVDVVENEAAAVLL